MKLSELHKIVSLYKDNDKEVAVKVTPPNGGAPVFVNVSRQLTGVDNLNNLFVIQTDVPVSKADGATLREIKQLKESLRWAETANAALKNENAHLRNQLLNTPK